MDRLTRCQMIRFSMFGIPIQVHPFFWLTMALIGGALRADTQQELLALGLFVIAGFISILVHEMGHALTAKKFGAQVHVVLEAFGGYAAYTGAKISRKQSFAITAAGPAFQMIFGALVYVLFLAIDGQANENGLHFLRVMIIISFVWAILNLLPVLPLDGGHLLNAMMGPQRIRMTLQISIATAVVAAVLIFMKTGSILFPIFLGMFAWQSFQALQEQGRR